MGKVPPPKKPNNEQALTKNSPKTSPQKTTTNKQKNQNAPQKNNTPTNPQITMLTHTTKNENATEN